jgi:hypothetical protein
MSAGNFLKVKNLDFFVCLAGALSRASVTCLQQNSKYWTIAAAAATIAAAAATIAAAATATATAPDAATILLPGASFPLLLPPSSFLLLFVDCCLPRRCHCRRHRYSLSPTPPFSLLFVDCCLPRRCHCRHRYSLSPPPPFSLLFVDCCLPRSCHCPLRRRYFLSTCPGHELLLRKKSILVNILLKYDASTWTQIFQSPILTPC